MFLDARVVVVFTEIADQLDRATPAFPPFLNASTTADGHSLDAAAPT